MRGDQGDEGALAERAALVALLRERPGRRGWTEITASVLEAGSALAVWQREVPPMLISPSAEPGPLDAAAAQIGRWADRGWRLLSILDADYPARLRGIHQAPPVLFARGTLIPGRLGRVGRRVHGRRPRAAWAIAAGVARGTRRRAA